MRPNLIAYNEQTDVLFNRHCTTKEQAKKEILSNPFTPFIAVISFKGQLYTLDYVIKHWPSTAYQSSFHNQEG